MKTEIAGKNRNGRMDFPPIENAGNKIEKIKLRRKCNGCNNHIEYAANSVDGVNRVKWDELSEMLTVEYDAGKTSLKKIEWTIEEAGHDTPGFKAEIKFYTLMPQCCQYRERNRTGMA
jgi:copper chaperone CopZ